MNWAQPSGGAARSASIVTVEFDSPLTWPTFRLRQPSISSAMWRATTSSPPSDERDPDQAWFWTPEWQAKEREADEAIRLGKFERFESEEAFEAALEARQHLHADT
jgi:hypothetical protein